MERRSVLAVGALSLTSSVAGCLSRVPGVSADPEKTTFAEHTGQHLVEIHNDRTSAVEATLTTTGEETNVDYSETFTLEAGESEEINELFTHGNERYGLRLETEDHDIEKTIQVGGVKNKSVFEIHSDGIEFRGGRRRTPDVTVANRLESRVEFTITIRPDASDESAVYDTIELPADGFESFTGMFSIGDEYDVRVEADGENRSTNHLASGSNTVWVTLDEDGLDIGVGQE